MLAMMKLKQKQGSIFKIFALSISFISILSLAGCQGSMALRRDCKQGDWGKIGNQDGLKAQPQNYEERKKFCEGVDDAKISADSSSAYLAGWVQGNFQYWRNLGVNDGRAAQAVAHFTHWLTFETHLKNKTPTNQPAYQQGWIAGNADYWQLIGEQDGKAGLPADQETARASSGQAFGFNRISYLQAWRTGNEAYWAQLGYLDAHEGKPESALKQRVSDAKQNAVLVREDAYLKAWNLEIVEYWKNLAWNDATSGRDVNQRRAEAKQNGVKFFEKEYLASWQQRLIKYWQDAGKDDGYGHPNLFEDRLKNAQADRVFVIPESRAVYQQAWVEQNTRYCQVDNAFSYGRKNHRMEIEVCQLPEQNRMRRAWSNGREYEHILARQSSHQFEVSRVSNKRYDLERRIDQIEREIKRDQENKNRPADAAATDQRREKEKHELREHLRRVDRELDDLRSSSYRFEMQLDQIKREIYQN